MDVERERDLKTLFIEGVINTFKITPKKISIRCRIEDRYLHKHEQFVTT